MPLSKPGQLTTEKSPRYYEAADVPERIHAMNASIKLILIVRNPVDRSVSHWLLRCFVAREANKTLDSCQKYEDSGILTSEGDVNTTNTLIFRSSYIKSIENWTRWFRLGTQLHIVDGHKLVSDPVSELEKVETFLGLRHHITQKNFVFNKKREFYCVVSQQGRDLCLKKDKGFKHPTLDLEVEEKLLTYFTPLNQHFYRVVGRDFGWS
ncbi:Heparan sulfate glucosamine 3-O-sulfotransferase 1 [Lamellibrachia satsuma]|nr:Heparan sulfate glucosamine 3-O-sulfotransferase 1 [Lamellibrachia satsuma]